MLPVIIFSSRRLSKKICIKKILKMIGKSNNKPASLVTGIIINIPATIWKIETNVK